MSKDFLGKRGRALEDEYFWKKEQALITRLREEGRRERERRVLKARLNADEAMLAELQKAGVTPDNLALLHLAPLVEVAWAEGEVTQRERELILALAERRGLGPDDPAFDQLTQWPRRQPGGCVFRPRRPRRQDAAGRHGASRARSARKDLVKSCTLVAEAAVESWGWSRFLRKNGRRSSTSTAD